MDATGGGNIKLLDGGGGVRSGRLAPATDGGSGSTKLLGGGGRGGNLAAVLPGKVTNPQVVARAAGVGKVLGGIFQHSKS